MASSATDNAFAALGRQPRKHPPVAQQLEEADHDSLPKPIPFAFLPILKVNGDLQDRGFVADIWLKQKAKNKTSNIRLHGTFLVERLKVTTKSASPPGFTAGKGFWVCNYCDTKGKGVVYSVERTGSAIKHLEKEHRIDVNERDENIDTAPEPAVPYQGSSKKRKHHVSVFDQQKQASQMAKGPVVQDSYSLFKKLLLEWIVTCDIPFNGITSPSFAQLLDFFDPQKTLDFLPKSATSVMDWLIEVFEDNQEAIITEIASKSLSRVHLSSDMWTAPNQKAVLGVVTHYLDQYLQYHTRLFAMRRVTGRHDAKNIADTILQVIIEYNIEDRVGWHIMDNAAVNDKMLRILLRAQNPKLTEQRAKQQAYDFRGRCFGHIINLVVHAFLTGNLKQGFNQLNSTQPRVLVELS